MLGETVVAEVAEHTQILRNVEPRKQFEHLLDQLIDTRNPQVKHNAIRGNAQVGAHLILKTDEDLELLDALFAEKRFVIQCPYSTDGQV